MPIRHSRYLVLLCLLAMLLSTGCGNSTMPRATGAVAPAKSQQMSAAFTASSATFTLAGGKNASYTLHTATPTSKLRHGHYEFTIDLADGNLSLFIVFYGYQGPGHYTLTNAVNGGDVHIGLKNDQVSWDLFVQPTTSCGLIIASDTPTGKQIAVNAAPSGSAGLDNLDRLRGSFTCPRLASSSSIHPQAPVSVMNGSFDLALLVES